MLVHLHWGDDTEVGKVFTLRSDNTWRGVRWITEETWTSLVKHIPLSTCLPNGDVDFDIVITLFMKIKYMNLFSNIYSQKLITGFIKWVTEEKPMWLGNIQQLKCIVGYESSGSWLCLQFHFAFLSLLNTNFSFSPVFQTLFCWVVFTCYFVCLNSDSNTIKCGFWIAVALLLGEKHI